MDFVTLVTPFTFTFPPPTLPTPSSSLQNFSPQIYDILFCFISHEFVGCTLEAGEFSSGNTAGDYAPPLPLFPESAREVMAAMVFPSCELHADHFKFFYMDGCLPTCICVLGTHRCLGTGVRDGCEPPRGCWQSILGPEKEQPVILSTWSITPGQF